MGMGGAYGPLAKVRLGCFLPAGCCLISPAIGDIAMCAWLGTWPQSPPNFLRSSASCFPVLRASSFFLRASVSARWLVIMLRRQQRSTGANHHPASRRAIPLTPSAGASPGHIISVNNRPRPKEERDLPGDGIHYLWSASCGLKLKLSR